MLDGAMILIRVAMIIAFFIFVYWLIARVYRALKGSREKRHVDPETYQANLDGQLRAAGHSEQFVEADRKIRALKGKRFEAKGELIVMLIFGVIFIFFLPPAGIFFTGFAIIMMIREGAKMTKAARAAEREIESIRADMPEN